MNRSNIPAAGDWIRGQGPGRRLLGRIQEVFSGEVSVRWLGPGDEWQTPDVEKFPIEWIYWAGSPRGNPVWDLIVSNRFPNARYSPLDEQRMVTNFMEAVGQHGASPAISDADLRINLITEEATEAIVAIAKGNLVEAVDGLCDLLYVVYGAAVSFGVDLHPIFVAIHEANMRKVGGPKRADGKVLPPEGWVPADVAALLREQGWKGS